MAPAALTSTPGASAAAWLPVQDLPTVPHDIAVDDDGDAVVVGLGADNVIRATDRRFGVPWWTAPVVLAGTGDTLPSKPKVTVDGNGNAVAVWSATNAGERLIRVANRPAGGTWSTPAKLSDNATNWGDHYALATDRQGTTTVVWTELEGSNYIVRTLSQAARRSWPAADAFPTTLTNSGEGTTASPNVAVGDHGKVTVVWIGFEPGPGGSGVVNSVRSRSRDTSSGAWSTVRKLSTGGLVETPTVVSDTAGNATAVWAQNAGGHLVRVARRPAGGSWTSAPGTDLGAGTDPQLAVASDGDLTAVWVAPDGDGEAIRTRTSTDRGASWDPPAVLATAPETNVLRYPQVAADGQGDVVAIWGRFDGPQATAEVARRVDGSTWSDEADLAVGQLSDYPVGAIDPKGHVTLAWKASAPTPGSSSIFDPAAPELRDLVVPTTGVVGEPVSVSVSPFDLTAVTTTWDFGGVSAAGTTASHTFATAGTFTFTVTGQDAAGNTSEASIPISISPAARRIDDSGPDFRPDPGANPMPGPDPKPEPKLNPVPTVKAPVLSRLQQTGARWTTAKRRGSRVPVGTSFRFRLDRAAKVRLTFEQLVTGRRSGKRCVKATGANRKKRACNRVEQRGAISAFGKAGSNGVEFRGKVGRRTLKPGRYRVRVTASADGKTSKAATKTFTIVR